MFINRLIMDFWSYISTQEGFFVILFIKLHLYPPYTMYAGKGKIQG